MKKIIFILIITLSFSVSKSQVLESSLFDDFFLGFGIKTTAIWSDNAATLPIVRVDTNQADVIGGSFEMVQPGLELRFTGLLNDKLRLVGAYSVDFFSSRERDPANIVIDQYYLHSLHIHNFNVGLHYVFYKIGFADAKFYIGLEPYLSYVNTRNYRFTRDYKIQNDLDQTIDLNQKDNALRLGGLYRLGVNGRIKNDWYVNLSAALSNPNLLLRENDRGELLTPSPEEAVLTEGDEDILTNFHISVMLEYRFR